MCVCVYSSLSRFSHFKSTIFFPQWLVHWIDAITRALLFFNILCMTRNSFTYTSTHTQNFIYDNITRKRLNARRENQ